MKLTPNITANLSRRLILLAPPSADTTGFREIETNQKRYASLVAGLQRLRGRVYLQIALDPKHVASDGRHIQSVDQRAWHLVAVNPRDEVVGCARYTLHENTVSYSELGVSRSALARSGEWGERLREAIESELATARDRSFRYAELGGWALSTALHCTTEAFRMMLTFYALSDWFGGVLGITTARTACSAPILRRIGGQPVCSRGVELPTYIDPDYHDELQVLKFDSSRPSSKFRGSISEFISSLSRIPVVAASDTTAPNVPFPAFAGPQPCVALA